jgi:UDP-glucose 4-epimerase
MTTLLITGISSFWGTRVATTLVQQAVSELRILGFDHKPPENTISGVEFVRADLSNPLTLDLLKAEAVEVVLHLDEHTASNKFLQMCAEAGIRRVLLKSSISVYGAHPANSLYLPETHPLDAKPYSFIRGMVELESFANGLTAQYPNLSLTVLRFAQLLGPTADTALARFLLDDRAPTLLGFNPLFQILHEDDALAALVHAVLNDTPGAYNLAAEDPLPLNKILALAGKLALPVAYPLARKLPSYLTPLPLEHLRYPCLGNLDRMQNEFGLSPAHSAEETITEFANEVRQTRYMPDALEEIANPLRKLVQRLKRTRGDYEETE